MLFEQYQQGLYLAYFNLECFIRLQTHIDGTFTRSEGKSLVWKFSWMRGEINGFVILIQIKKSPTPLCVFPYTCFVLHHFLCAYNNRTQSRRLCLQWHTASQHKAVASGGARGAAAPPPPPKKKKKFGTKISFSEISGRKPEICRNYLVS